MSFGKFFDKNFIVKLEKNPKKWLRDNFMDAFKPTKKYGLMKIQSIQIVPLIAKYKDGNDCWIYLFPYRKPSKVSITGDCVQGRFSSKESALMICERIKAVFESIDMPAKIEVPSWFNTKKVRPKRSYSVSLLPCDK
jgi:hypothetical protein